MTEEMPNGARVDKDTQMFLSLVTSMHMGAMYQLGKVASPMTGKIERNLPQAQYTIDLLGMLEKRTSGNLSPDEASLLNRTLSELRMNYIDESSKPEPVEAAGNPPVEESQESQESQDSKEASGTDSES